MSTVRLTAVALCAGIVVAGNANHAARAAEGGASHYLPGTAGDLGLALPPKPGLQAANVFWYQSGNVSQAVLQGRVDANLDLSLALDLAMATYTFERKILGGVYTVGAVLPFGYAELSADFAVPGVGSLHGSEDSFNLSDMVITPFQMNWSLGDFHFKLAENVFIPTGAYDVDDRVNLGRNYWSFDTLAAVTWLNADTGTSVSVAPGIMVNTENNATDYKTGAEFHVDFTANQFLSKTFAVGLKGYWYQQVSGDSGSGAVLGDFKSNSVGIGPGFVWTPGFANGQLAIAGKWIHDLHAERRFKSNYGMVTLGWKF